MNLSRRHFLKFLGAATVVGSTGVRASNTTEGLPFKPLAPKVQDHVSLVDGLTYSLLIAFRDPINKRGEIFGFDNDYIACLPGEGPDRVTLWVNHEDIKPFLVSGWDGKRPRTADEVRFEREAVGGSIMALVRKDGKWQVDLEGSINRRIHGDTPIPLVSQRAIRESQVAIGTFANCAGGVTPWGTVLTCEENYDTFFGEVSFKDGERKVSPGRLQWEQFGERPPEHYGWVVEIDTQTGKAQKHVALGRFSHESATCTTGAGYRPVVYSGDDEKDECFYKFIGDTPGNLASGTLYVADLDAGEWRPLTLDDPRLKGKFKDQTELLIRTREAAHLVGGTPLDRPEDVEIHPLTGDVYVALTNNSKHKNYHGSILKITEKDGYAGLRFSHESFLVGGEETGFSCPDNLLFDRAGNLWFTCDISGKSIGHWPYKAFGNNSLFVVPVAGPAAGKALRVATAPKGAEFTGPCFSPDQRQLFLSVQHPGDGSKPGKLVSHWPDGGESVPRPGVIVIEGPLLDQFTQA